MPSKTSVTAVRQTTGGRTAYIIGASLSGLLAAAALSDRFDHVVLFERDNLPDDDQVRRGVPQGRHLHMLLSSGRTAMEELLPGFTSDMLAAGAHGGDLQRDLQWIVDGEPLPRLPSGLYGLRAGLTRRRPEWTRAGLPAKQTRTPASRQPARPCNGPGPVNLVAGEAVTAAW